MIVALLMVGIFAGLLSTGRAQNIERRDIALEELREAGMRFEIGSLQNTIFFINDRGAQLYREAGFEPEDFLLALGRPSEFSLRSALIFSVVDRVEEDERGGGGRGERFAELLRNALVDPSQPTPLLDFVKPFGLFDETGAPCPHGNAPLFTYLAQREAIGTAAKIWGVDAIAEDRRRGRTPPPMQDAAGPLPIPDELRPRATGGDAGELMQASGCATPDGLTLREAHIAATLYPIDALLGGREKDGARTTYFRVSDLRHACDIARAMVARGVAPNSVKALQYFESAAARDDDVTARSGFTPDEIAECLAAFQWRPDPFPTDQQPEIVKASELTGYVVDSGADDGSCSVEPWRLAASDRGVQAICRDHRCAADELDGLPVWQFDVAITSGADTEHGMIQAVATGARLLHEVEDGFRATDWSLFDPAFTRPMVFDTGYELVYVQPPSASIDGAALFSEYLAGRQEDGEVLFVRRPVSVAEGGEDAKVAAPQPLFAAARPKGDSAADEGRVFTHAHDLSPGAPPKILILSTDDSSVGLRFEFDAVQGDACVELRDLSTGEAISSAHAPYGERAVFDIENFSADKSREHAVFVWPASGLRVPLTTESDAAPETTAITWRATPPRPFKCAPALNEAVETVDWLEGAELVGALGEGEELFCRVRAEGALSVSLTMTGLSADVDIEVLDAESAAALGSGTAGGSEDEAVQFFARGGEQIIRIYNVAATASPFRLTVAEIEEAPPLVDDYPANAQETAHDLGVLGDGVSITDSIGMVSSGDSDWYRLEILEGAPLSFRVDQLMADIDIDVIDETGVSIGSGANSNADPENVAAYVSPGVYFIHIYRFGEPSTYRLEISPE